MAPLVSLLKDQGIIEARAVHQNPSFAAGVQFARTEGILPAPEANHAIRAAIDEALVAKAEGDGAGDPLQPLRPRPLRPVGLRALPRGRPRGPRVLRRAGCRGAGRAARSSADGRAHPDTPVRIAVLGLGLIGGSIARAVRPYGWPVAAWTPSGGGPRQALEAGLVDEAAPSVADAVEGADLVVLAAPASACLDILDELAGPARGALGAGAVVTDVASTKALLVARAAAHGLRFVGGHPMAGRETSGFGAADATLFRGRPWVVVAPPDDEAAAGRVEMLAAACGARPVRMGAAEHDAAVAAISHAPLVLAAALVEAMAGGPGEPPAPGWDDAAALAASGWASATRLARGDPAMGAAIAATNAGPLATRLRDVLARLDAWIELLEDRPADGLPDEALLRARLEAARARLATTPGGSPEGWDPGSVDP